MRLFLVHGSIANGLATWAAQRPLEQRFDVVVWNRPGYPPNAPRRADRLRGAGGRAGRAARARRPPLRALVRRRDLAARRGGAARPRVADGRRAAGVRSRARAAGGRPAASQQFERFLAAGPHEPVDYLRGFLPIVGSAMRDPRPPAAGARAGHARGDGRAAAVGGGDPVRRAAGGAGSRSSSSPAGTPPPSRRSATCSSASSAPSARCSTARATRCRGSASRSTACWRVRGAGGGADRSSPRLRPLVP